LQRTQKRVFKASDGLVPFCATIILSIDAAELAEDVPTQTQGQEFAPHFLDAFLELAVGYRRVYPLCRETLVLEGLEVIMAKLHAFFR
jgi:hypothetical protein